MTRGYFSDRTGSVGNFGEPHSVECRRGKAISLKLSGKRTKTAIIAFFEVAAFGWAAFFVAQTRGGLK